MVQNIQMDEATLAALRILQSQALRRGEALGPYLQSLAERAETETPATPERVVREETAEEWTSGCEPGRRLTPPWIMKSMTAAKACIRIGCNEHSD